MSLDLVCPGCRLGPVVPAHSAPPLVVLPLDAEAPAVKLVVIVVDGVGVTKPEDNICLNYVSCDEIKPRRTLFVGVKI